MKKLMQEQSLAQTKIHAHTFLLRRSSIAIAASAACYLVHVKAISLASLVEFESLAIALLLSTSLLLEVLFSRCDLASKIKCNKEVIDSLNQDIVKLQKENAKLMDIIHTYNPEHFQLEERDRWFNHFAEKK